MAKQRLDVLLVERGLADSRAQAQALVMAGRVPGHSKPGEQVRDDIELEVESPPPYVSRAGYKLAHALEAFGIDVAGLDALDVGASTGGFTDVLLQRGARRVIALDVGYGQLHSKIRDDPRVVVLERTVFQQEVPEAARSRVSSYDALGSFVLIPLGSAIAGPVASVIGVHGTLVAAGAISLACIGIVIAQPSVRALGTRPPAQPVAA